MRKYQPSLLHLLGFSVVVTVGIVISIQSAIYYKTMKNRLIEGLKQESEQITLTLANNIAGFIQAYSPNEYKQLVHHHMENPNYQAIIVSDYEMGKLMGDLSYITGKIRDANWIAVNYEPDSEKNSQSMQNFFYRIHQEIEGQSGKKLGTVDLYLSDRQILLELEELIFDSIFQGGFIALVLLISLYISIRYYAVRPLAEMAVKIANTDKEGIPLHEISLSGSKEIRILSGMMNSMIKTIKNSRDELIEQRRQIQYQANHDSLTGLTNRYLFNDRLKHALKKAKRNNSILAVLFIDLDHFKQVNDSYGHDMGDQLLVEVTSLLNKTVRAEDTIARMGGDEFVIMIEDFKDVFDASILSGKIIQSFSNSIAINEHDLYVSCSIGISLYPHNGQTSEDLLKQADAAMYKAKHEGRNNYQFYNSEMTDRAIEKLTMETQLRSAILNDEFVVYYQPQVNATNGELSGMEALVRWNSPTMGLVPPGSFIPVAESTGRMVEIDRISMMKAMQQVSEWRNMGLNPGVLSLNLTLQHLLSRDFIPGLMSIMHNAKCNADCIELEITEGHIMSRPEETIKILHELNDIGIRLSLDDFGTGYSSLGYLKKLPVDKLKIDRSFIIDLPEDEDDIAIIRSIIALSQGMNLEVLAEGVETKAQKDLLLELGCEYIQGYYYGKPQSATDMQQRLETDKLSSHTTLIYLKDRQ